jgi:hypothetical protein
MPSASLGTQQLSSPRPRSSSLTPSTRSSHSNITTVEEHWEFVESPAVKRQPTVRVNTPNLSRWDMIKGFFRPNKLARKIVTEIRPEIEDKGPDVCLIRMKTVRDRVLTDQ